MGLCGSKSEGEQIVRVLRHFDGVPVMAALVKDKQVANQSLSHGPAAPFG